MLEVGQEVVLMSVPGRFQIIAIHGEVLTLEDERGRRRTVLSRAVRLLPSRPA